ncbi:hypothetical protein BU24DRAFT_436817 [Aaosphaeria arxii CBS 175.79]|uniref:Zn(2)-C6 fungal-type domain-containing protein n=1 Tax=Aaosphaeria arxii CBS 175.79 TaxID=1450172 RepID=A0A6A5XAD8_9PLEO|nr:uncharacterized protein BU24DRAFT_436817 [Aaosphaeria arxii CBS 175.79]KAF2009922.1 hypothetical protein BU24DRAFT_436817 [Aaosphaeria arxii CBS 175.79]
MDSSSISAPDAAHTDQNPKPRRKGKKDVLNDEGSKKRRCISSACVPCRKRKSKCDGTTPACSACAAVYNTECIYDPNSDHRRKGVYKKDIDNLKTRNSTLQTLIQAILNYPEEDVAALVQQIRTCESLDAVAEGIIARENGEEEEEEEQVVPYTVPAPASAGAPLTFESQLSGKMGELRLEDGSTRYIGGTSHLIYLGAGTEDTDQSNALSNSDQYQQQENPLTSWTTVTSDPELVLHLINMYFCWHYTFFTTLSKNLFYRDFLLGKPPPGSRRKMEYCTPLLVNAMLALGCHFTSWPTARAVRDDAATAGDHFFKEAKRLILEGDLHEVPALTTVQALALMSVREAGCGREAKGWVYSGMSFRMACDLGLNLNSGGMQGNRGAIDETEEDARRITFWGCFLFDKCWSNYLGRLPQLPNASITAQKFEVFPVEDSDTWSAYTDSGFSQAHAQPSRTRAVALQISKLCEISSDLINFFYNPIDMDKTKGKQAELKKLSEIHQRLETWRRELPKELEPKEGGLPSMLVMHMFFQLLFIHLFRPFLKYNPNNSPLPSHVSPRKLCTQAAQMISKLLRLYKRSHGLRQICNIAVYIAHSACTIHLLNLPEKNAKRDIIHGVKHLEEIAESWLCARRTLGILSVLAKNWKVELPEEAATVLARTDAKFGPYGEVLSPRSSTTAQDVGTPAVHQQQQQQQQPETSPALQPYSIPLATTTSTTTFFEKHGQPMQSLTSEALRHASEARSLPPNDASAFAYPRGQRDINPSTPASTAGIDNSVNSTHNSPSQLFGGVEQLVREGQDWWLRDQSQLAVGFDNWNLNPDEIAWLTSNTGAVGSPGSFTANSVVGNGDMMNGGPVANGNSNPQPNNMNGFNGYGGVMNTYNENEWYQ